jgi:hypothetical protein
LDERSSAQAPDAMRERQRDEVDSDSPTEIAYLDQHDLTIQIRFQDD